MALKDLVIKNRSYRLFDMTQPIPREVLLDCIDTTRFAPASVNIQPIVYKISDTPEMNAKIRPYTFWAKMARGSLEKVCDKIVEGIDALF